MKPNKGNYKLMYQNIKKQRQKHKKSSQKSQSEINDDSLDLIEKTISKQSRTNTNNNQGINQEDLKQLRTCISNQFKKSNFINFSAIKNKSNNYQIHTQQQIINRTSQHATQTKTTNKMPQPQYNTRNFLTSHNRSQSCPFIQPLYIYDNVSTKDGKNDDMGIAFSSVKIDKQQKKKISMQNLSKNRNKLHMGSSAQKKNFNHNYSNSLTQSSNTVIVHNIPNDIHQNIIPNQNLSSILYKKQEQDEQKKTQKQRKRLDNDNTIFLRSPIVDQKKSGISQQTLQKKTLNQVSFKSSFFIKTKIEQRMTRYKMREQKQRFQIDNKGVNIKGQVLDKLLQPYNGPLSRQDIVDKQMNSQKQSIVVDDRQID